MVLAMGSKRVQFFPEFRLLGRTQRALSTGPWHPGWTQSLVREGRASKGGCPGISACLSLGSLAN